MAQFYPVQQCGSPMMQQAPGPFPGGNMMPQHSPDGSQFSGSGAATPTLCVPGGSPCWQQAHPSQAQQSPFPMPLSPPHDLMQPCAPSQPQQAPQQQQAYFEMMPDGGQASQGQMAALG